MDERGPEAADRLEKVGALCEALLKVCGARGATSGEVFTAMALAMRGLLDMCPSGPEKASLIRLVDSILTDPLPEALTARRAPAATEEPRPMRWGPTIPDSEVRGL